MTVKEAAELLEVTPALVYKLCDAGRMRHRRIGLGRGVIRIDPEHLEEFRRGCEVAPREADAEERPARPERVARLDIPDLIGERVRRMTGSKRSSVGRRGS